MATPFMTRVPRTIVALATTAVALTALPLQALQAQRTSPKDGNRTNVLEHMSTLVGLVVDSLHGGTLNGATILLDGTTLSAVTDSSGKFRIDSIPPGDYRIAVFHPVLDTLGYSIATRPLRMGVDSIRQVVLGTPSAQTMVAKSCPEAKRRLGPVAIMGRVTDPDTHAPVDSATVSFVWSEVKASKDIGVKKLEYLRKATTDAAGFYTICGVGAKAAGTLLADRYRDSTAEVPIDMGDAPLAFQDLTLSKVAQDSTAPTRGSAELSGRVVDDKGTPIAGAIVRVRGTPDSARTAVDGRFKLTGLPSGTRAVLVRRLGYSPGGDAVELSSTKPVVVELAMIKSNPTLDAVKVTGKFDSVLKANGFTERRRMGFGHYLTPDDIARRQPQNFADLFFTMPGFSVNNGQFGSKVTYRGGGCVTFYIDGIQQFNVSDGQLQNLVRPEQVMAVETYSNTSAPMQYRPPGQSCAIVLVWTNRTVR